MLVSWENGVGDERARHNGTTSWREALCSCDRRSGMKSKRTLRDVFESLIGSHDCDVVSLNFQTQARLESRNIESGWWGKRENNIRNRLCRALQTVLSNWISRKKIDSKFSVIY